MHMASEFNDKDEIDLNTVELSLDVPHMYHRHVAEVNTNFLYLMTENNQIV